MRQRLLCILFSILFPALIWGQANNSKPNIILILSDDLGYKDLSSYGSKEIKTPHIDSLARDGVKLLQAYANGFVCTPSRVALMTGRYPQRAGFEYVIMDRDRGLSTKETILARMLKEHGYVTGAFGKWHLGYKAEYGPNAHGFDEFFGFLGSDLDYYAHHDNSGTPGLYDNTQLVNRSGYLTDLITDRAVSFIEKHLKEPFFLYVPYNAPHWPFQPPNRPQDVRDRTTYSPLNGNRADYIRMVEQMDVGGWTNSASTRKTRVDEKLAYHFYE